MHFLLKFSYLFHLYVKYSCKKSRQVIHDGVKCPVVAYLGDEQAPEGHGFKDFEPWNGWKLKTKTICYG